MRSSLRRLAAVLLLAACDENPVEPLPTETSFTFSYRQGTDAWQSFASRGPQPARTPIGSVGAWVYATTLPPAGASVMIKAHQPAGTGWAYFQVQVPNTPGADSVFLGSPEANTCPGGPAPCAQAYFVIQAANGAIAERCWMANGKLYVTRRTEQWLSGELSGTGTCTAGGATRTFEVRDGAFDVALPTPETAPG